MLLSACVAAAFGVALLAAAGPVGGDAFVTRLEMPGVRLVFALGLGETIAAFLVGMPPGSLARFDALIALGLRLAAG